MKRVCKKYFHRCCRLLCLTAALVVFISARAAREGDLPRSTPEEQGLRSADVQAFLDAIVMQPEMAEGHSAIVVRHGHVVGEAYPAPFSADYAHTVYSVSKTFTAAAVGLAVDRGLLDVTDRVGDILKDRMPANIGPNLARMTVQDLLTMSSGITPDWKMRDNYSNWLSVWLRKPDNGPGEKFAYDSMCSYVLSAIVQRVTGQTVLEYLNEHILGPMGVTDAQWELSPEGICTGGWGMRVRPEVMAKFGLMLLDGGRYEGRRLLSEDWVSRMMTPHIRANSTEGYGYQMWQCGRFGAWRADGAFGQYIVVIPEKDMVVAMTQCSGRGPLKSLAPVWKLAATAADNPLSPDEAAAETLRKRQGSYSFLPVRGARSHRNGALIQGRTFALPWGNRTGWRSVTFSQRGDRMVLGVVTDGGRRYDVECGQGKWLTVRTPVPPPYSIKARGRFRGLRQDFAVSGSYAWLPDGSLCLAVLYPDWISAVYLTFAPDVSAMTVRQNYLPKPYTLTVRPQK